MSQLIVEEISKSKNNGVLHLEVLVNGHKLVRDITASKVDTVQKLAIWLVTQVEVAPFSAQAQPRRQAIIDYHVDVDGPVIDDVQISLLVEEQAMLDIEGLPGWASWTGTEAADWIETNVTSLASAKVALKAMARLLVAERDVIKKLVERVGL